MYTVYNKFKGYLSDNGQRQYYSENVNHETLKFETKEEANLLCDIYEKAIKIND